MVKKKKIKRVLFLENNNKAKRKRFNYMSKFMMNMMKIINKEPKDKCK